MHTASLKNLADRLNRFTTSRLEDALARCVAHGHYEAGPEHLLLSLASTGEGEFSEGLRAFGKERAALARMLEKSLETMQRGNTGRPVLSPLLVELLHNAWTAASLDMLQNRVTSGSVLLAMVSTADRFGADYADYIGSIGYQSLLAKLPDIVRNAGERERDDKADDLTGESASVQKEREAGRTSPAGGHADDRPGNHFGEKSPSLGEALDKFCVNITARAEAGEIDPVFGREPHMRQLIDILARRRKNNPIIVGEAGVGKTALVEGLALRIVDGDVPEFLRGVHLLTLDLALLQAGAGVRGEFEKRLKAVIDEVRTSVEPVVLFIDEAHMLVGSGETTGGSDAANIVKPVLARGEMRTIAATTWREYAKFFEKDAALSRRFQPVALDEPDLETTVDILRGLASHYEQAHGVRVGEDALRAAAELSDRYIHARLLPDKAVDLLDTGCARVKVGLTAKPSQLEDVQSRLDALHRRRRSLEREATEEGGAESSRLLELSAKLSDELDELTTRRDALAATWHAQAEQVRRIAELREAPEEDESAQRLKAELTGTEEELLVRPDVDREIMARVVSEWTGVPLGRLLEDESETLLHLEEAIGRRIKGQDGAVNAIARKLRASKSGLGEPSRPLGVFLLAGPSGVGKTETALAVAEILFGSEDALVVCNMGEYQEKHTVSRLIGSPPGYVGYGEGGVLTEAVRRRPYCAVLLDEAEKADSEVMNLFLQVFDRGRINDGEGRSIDFRNTVIFLTTNLGDIDLLDMHSRARGDNGDENIPSDADMLAAVRPRLTRHFKPAFLARTQPVAYRPLARKALMDIARMRLEGLAERLQTTSGLQLVYDDDCLDALAGACTHVDTGARTIDLVVNERIMPALSRLVIELAGSEPEAGMVRLKARGDSKFQVRME